MTGLAGYELTPEGRTGLDAILADPRSALAAFDYDGTLSPIATRPEDAARHPGALEALHELAARLGSVVLISGRPGSQLLELSGLTAGPDAPPITVLAQYGLQRWDSATGELTEPDPLPGVAGARIRLAALIKSAPAGVSLEDKTQALVVHTRQAADPAGAMAALRPELEAIAAEAGLQPHPARAALELRPPGFDKGGALRGIVRERGARSLLFAGDDLGDVPAFDVVRELRAAGTPGLSLVSDSPEVTGVRESADLLLDGPAAVVAFLQELVRELG